MKSRAFFLIGGFVIVVMIAAGILAWQLSSNDDNDSNNSSLRGGGPPRLPKEPWTTPRAIPFSVDWEAQSWDAGCKNVTDDIEKWPIITAECPYGIVLMGGGGNCKRVNHVWVDSGKAHYRKYECKQTLSDLEPIHFKCYGNTMGDLNPTVTFHASGNFTCDTYRHTDVGWPNNIESHIYGGTVTVDVTAGLCNTTSNRVEINSVYSKDCESKFSCSSAGCTEEQCLASTSWLKLEMPAESYLERSAISTSCLEEFTLNAPVGANCSDDIQCESEVCVRGICLAEGLMDNEAGCEDNKDCQSYACAARTEEELTPKVCCSSGRTVEYNGTIACADQT